MLVGSLWCGHFLTNVLKHKHAPSTDSVGACVKATICPLNLAFLSGGKYFPKNFSTKLSHIVIEFGESKYSHALAFPYKDLGNNFSLRASSKTPFVLKERQIFIKSLRCL